MNNQVGIIAYRDTKTNEFKNPQKLILKDKPLTQNTIDYMANELLIFLNSQNSLKGVNKHVAKGTITKAGNTAKTLGRPLKN